jgi:ABC-type Zn uptake system ZnuABC Zn-binding protein ZnuA
MKRNSIRMLAARARRAKARTALSHAVHAGNVLALIGLLLAPAASAAPLRVVASLTDLGSIAASVGGERVEVVAIARSGADPHRVEVLPSYMSRVARAQLYLKVGLELDRWADPIIDGSHNNTLRVVDCSQGVATLEKPTTRVDASMGDVHPEGNPHYWLDPRNAAVVARTVATALTQLDPAGSAHYAARADSFAAAAAALVTRGQQQVAAMPTRAILTYHRSWSYFAATFGLEVASTIEPFPGIPPTARHLDDLVRIVRERDIRVAIAEPYFSADACEFLQRQTGVAIVRESASCDDVGAGSYFAHLERVLASLAGATGAGR